MSSRGKLKVINMWAAVLSRAEAIKHAIACHIENNKVEAADAFGIWKNHEVDGLRYQEQVRSEW